MTHAPEFVQEMRDKVTLGVLLEETARMVPDLL